MRFFYDCEFIENGSTIDLISIGIVAENGEYFYAISTEFKKRKASQWVKDNVLAHLPPRVPALLPPWGSPRVWEESLAWKSRKQIRDGVLAFVNSFEGKPEFWGYYSAYDHVALCQLFGTMMDLPKGWPMYTRDLKQLADSLGCLALPAQESGLHNALADARWTREAYNYLRAIEANA
jgi:hypothetical protein